MSFQKNLQFLHDATAANLPEEVVNFSRRCLLDLVGVMISGSQTDLAKIISGHASEHFGAGTKPASIMLMGKSASPVGAALANGMMIDSIDAHDGFKPVKGHVGCHVLPAILAFREAEQSLDGMELLADLVVGYEFGARAGLALHGSVSDYHTSGAWGAVTAAALGSRIMQFDTEKTRHAIGIGEYHGPRSQMMRCIDHPTMVKDGSGWGAMAGVSAAYLAASGFTGAPALTIEADDIQEYWADLGTRWTILEQYFKPYPVCRWAQPATEATLTIVRENGLNHEDIDHIEVFSFHEACRLATREPIDTEQAQYSLPFPVSAALVFGQVGPEEISGASLRDERVLRLSNSMVLKEHQPYNDNFPADRLAHVSVHLKNGDVIISETHRANGDPETPFSNEEIATKFHFLADRVVGEVRASTIRNIIADMGISSNVGDLLAALRQQ